MRRHSPDRNIIIATPSNSAANLFVETFMKIPELAGDFKRLVSHNQTERGLIPESIVQYCSKVNITSCSNDDYSEQERLTKHQIKQFPIIISTLDNLGSFLRMDFGDHFKTVVIDEAAQASEPDCYIPLTLLEPINGQVILAGDHHQLGPCSMSKYVKKFKLRKSLFERLIQVYERIFESQPEIKDRFISKLVMNYRSHENLLPAYNDLFYDGKLVCTIREDSIEVKLLKSLMTNFIIFPQANDATRGVYFIDVADGRNNRRKNSCSWMNEQEVAAIQNFIGELITKEIHKKFNIEMSKFLGLVSFHIIFFCK